MSLQNGLREKKPCHISAQLNQSFVCVFRNIPSNSIIGTF